jgi:protein-disulfide isomerase
MGDFKKMEDKITISKTTVWKAITAILAVLLIISIFTGGFGIKSEETKKTAPKAAAPSAPPSGAGADMAKLADDDAVKGDADAPVTIIEWSDYECPFCVRFIEQTYGQIVEQYINKGKVNLIFRDYPLGFHANAQKAAEAAECAGEQGEYYAMHDKLFADGVKGGVASFKEFAKDLGLDTDDFNECLDSDAMAEEVKKDMADGQAAGIRGTPGFIINGKLISGAQPFDVFKQAIEAALAE